MVNSASNISWRYNFNKGNTLTAESQGTSVAMHTRLLYHIFLRASQILNLSDWFHSSS